MTRIITAAFFVHGLIHLMGFAKAFGLADLPQLTQPISRLAGAAWLVAAAMMAAAGVLVYQRDQPFAIVAIAAIACSQIVIALSWRDAWAGTIANVVLAAAVVYLRR